MSSNLTNPLNPIPLRFKKINGIERLQKAIQKELQSLQSQRQKIDFDCPELACSNLPQLLSLFQYIQKSEPSAVLKSFPFNGIRTKKLIVDVVSLHGDEWVKISARNPKSLQLLASGGGGYGTRSIIDHAEDYLQCASENVILFRPPKVKFVFASGIGQSLAEKLEALGVQVEGVRIEDNELKNHERIKNYEDFKLLCDTNKNDNGCIEDSSLTTTATTTPVEIEPGALKYNTFTNPDLTDVKKLNLDITALLCYVSNLTNGHTETSFKKPILEQQRHFEIKRPQKGILDAAIKGKELYCCETAYREFLSILEIVGGEEEKKRADILLKSVKVVPDQTTPRTQKLQKSLGGHLKKRSLTIFSTGDAIQAVTLTANANFVRSSKTQGVDFPVFIHESRALTEGKELYEQSVKKEKKNLNN